MKKIFSILSLSLILFNSLVPWFSHAYTEQEQEAIKLFEELIYSNNETETNTSDNNWLINTLEESFKIYLMTSPQSNKKLKILHKKISEDYLS